MHYSSASSITSDSSYSSSGAVVLEEPGDMSVYTCALLLKHTRSKLKGERYLLIGLRGFARECKKREIHNLEADVFRLENLLDKLRYGDEAPERPAHGDTVKYSERYKVYY